MNPLHDATVDLRARRWSFVLGPPKAGTTWIHSYLESHPEVVTPFVKETFFFDRHYHRGWGWYSRQFPTSGKVRQGQRCVEVCHDYLFDSQALERIRSDTSPKSAIVVARHPVDRAVSAYLFHRRHGYSGTLREAIGMHPDIVEHSRYAHWVPRAQEILGSGVLRLVDFALLECDESAFARQLCSGLGVDPVPPAVSRQQRLPSAVPRTRAVARTAKAAAIALRRVRGQRMVQSLKTRPALQRALYRTLTDHERRSLVTPADLRFLTHVLDEDIAWYVSVSSTGGS